jgi:hypothetical protein
MHLEFASIKFQVCISFNVTDIEMAFYLSPKPFVLRFQNSYMLENHFSRSERGGIWSFQTRWCTAPFVTTLLQLISVGEKFPGFWIVIGRLMSYITGFNVLEFLSSGYTKKRGLWGCCKRRRVENLKHSIIMAAKIIMQMLQRVSRLDMYI